MRLGIDVRKLGDGGIGEYIRETLIAAVRLCPELEVVAFGAAEQRELLPIERVEWVATSAGKYSLAEHFTLPAAIRGRRLDLFHAPHYVLPLGLSLPAVVTVHDTIHLSLPRTRFHPLYARFMMGSACRRARKVITVSETTARDLESRLGAPRAKIEVIWNGVAPRFRRLPEPEIAAALERLGVRRPYV
ncbi:MAG: glycosyltransferase, partial [Candidatus Binatia bacterium]